MILTTLRSIFKNIANILSFLLLFFYKPRNCGTFLGRSYVPKAKKAKLHSPACVKILEQNGFGIFSVKTHNKDLRCLVIVDQGQVHCTAEKCMEVRSYVNSTE